jgi:hypothetical protein
MAVGDYANNYDSQTNTFDSYRKDSYDNIVREIYEERKDELAGFIDIGKNADTAFNAYVNDYAANGYSSKDEAAQAIIACAGAKGEAPDHNHYSNGTIACKLMLEGYNGTPGIVSELAGWSVTADNIGAETADDAMSTGFKGTINAGILYSGKSFDTLKGTVTSEGVTKAFSGKLNTNVTLDKGASCYVGLFIEGLADSNATATMEVE